MIQFNLLPDVKIEYMRTRRMKRILYVGAIMSVVISVLMIVLTFSMAAVQKNHVNNLDKDISSLETEINSIGDLNKILTVQNQLDTLPGLYDTRPAVDRLPVYINQVTPADADISRLNLDFSTLAIELEGVANNLETVNKFVDALKFTTYTVSVDDQEASEQEEPAFSDVVLIDFGKDEQEGFSTFTITMMFNAVIFDDTQKVTLKVPSKVTTRSELEAPEEGLFTEQPEEEEGQ